MVKPVFERAVTNLMWEVLPHGRAADLGDVTCATSVRFCCVQVWQ